MPEETPQAEKTTNGRDKPESRKEDLGPTTEDIVMELLTDPEKKFKDEEELKKAVTEKIKEKYGEDLIRDAKTGEPVWFTDRELAFIEQRAREAGIPKRKEENNAEVARVGEVAWQAVERAKEKTGSSQPTLEAVREELETMLGWSLDETQMAELEEQYRLLVKPIVSTNQEKEDKPQPNRREAGSAEPKDGKKELERSEETKEIQTSAETSEEKRKKRGESEPKVMSTDARAVEREQRRRLRRGEKPLTLEELTRRAITSLEFEKGEEPSYKEVVSAVSALAAQGLGAADEQRVWRAYRDTVVNKEHVGKGKDAEPDKASEQEQFVKDLKLDIERAITDKMAREEQKAETGTVGPPEPDSKPDAVFRIDPISGKRLKKQMKRTAASRGGAADAEKEIPAATSQSQKPTFEEFNGIREDDDPALRKILAPMLELPRGGRLAALARQAYRAGRSGNGKTYEKIRSKAEAEGRIIGKWINEAFTLGQKVHERELDESFEAFEKVAAGYRVAASEQDQETKEAEAGKPGKETKEPEKKTVLKDEEKEKTVSQQRREKERARLILYRLIAGVDKRGDIEDVPEEFVTTPGMERIALELIKSRDEYVETEHIGLWSGDRKTREAKERYEQAVIDLKKILLARFIDQEKQAGRDVDREMLRRNNAKILLNMVRNLDVELERARQERSLEEREKGFLRKAWEWYLKQNQPRRLAISLAISSGVIAGAATAGILPAFLGGAAVAKYGLPAYLGMRAARSAALSPLTVPIASRLAKWRVGKYAQKIEEKEIARTEQATAAFATKEDSEYVRVIEEGIKALEDKEKEMRLWAEVDKTRHVIDQEIQELEKKKRLGVIWRSFAWSFATGGVLSGIVGIGLARAGVGLEAVAGKQHTGRAIDYAGHEPPPSAKADAGIDRFLAQGKQPADGSLARESHPLPTERAPLAQRGIKPVSSGAEFDFEDAWDRALFSGSGPQKTGIGSEVIPGATEVVAGEQLTTADIETHSRVLEGIEELFSAIKGKETLAPHGQRAELIEGLERIIEGERNKKEVIEVFKSMLEDETIQGPRREALQQVVNAYEPGTPSTQVPEALPSQADGVKAQGQQPAQMQKWWQEWTQRHAGKAQPEQTVPPTTDGATVDHSPTAKAGVVRGKAAGEDYSPEDVHTAGKQADADAMKRQIGISEFKDVIDSKGLKGHDSVWKSTKEIFLRKLRDDPDVGYEATKHEGETLEAWAERQTGNILRRYPEETKLDLVHNGDEVIISKDKSGVLSLRIEESSGQARGRLSEFQPVEQTKGVATPEEARDMTESLRKKVAAEEALSGAEKHREFARVQTEGHRQEFSEWLQKQNEQYIENTRKLIARENFDSFGFGPGEEKKIGEFAVDSLLEKIPKGISKEEIWHNKSELLKGMPHSGLYGYGEFSKQYELANFIRDAVESGNVPRGYEEMTVSELLGYIEPETGKYIPDVLISGMKSPMSEPVLPEKPKTTGDIEMPDEGGAGDTAPAPQEEALSFKRIAGLSAGKQRMLDNLIYSKEPSASVAYEAADRIIREVQTGGLTAEDWARYWAAQTGAREVSDEILNNIKKGFEYLKNGPRLEQIRVKRALEATIMSWIAKDGRVPGIIR
jgi:hypothetical protein